jgi:hypothetical protein
VEKLWSGKEKLLENFVEIRSGAFQHCGDGEKAGSGKSGMETGTAVTNPEITGK